MVRKNRIKLGSWKYRPIYPYNEPVLILDASLKLPGKNGWSETISFIVDPGYFGELIIRNHLFELLGFDKQCLSKDHWRQITTASGEVLQFRSAMSTLSFSGKSFQIIIETNEKMVGNIIGIQFLKRFIAHLNGPESTWSLFA